MIALSVLAMTAPLWFNRPLLQIAVSGVEQGGAGASTAGWRAAVAGALDGAAFTIPLSLGSITLVFAQVSPALVGPAVLATLVSLAVIQFVRARSARPCLYAARVFEATALAAMLESLGRQFGRWSIPDTPEVRLALMCVICAGAGLVVGLLYLMRADRFTRLIPAPVFAGFLNSVALVLIITQSGSLIQLAQDGSIAAVASIAVTSFVVAVLVRRYRPAWPAAASGLAAGLLVGLAWLAAAQPVAMIGAGSAASPAWPVALADFRSALPPGLAERRDLAAMLLVDALLLGMMAFLNTIVTAQALTHIDERPRESQGGLLLTAACMAAGGAMGSVPVVGSTQSAIVAMRSSPLTPKLMVASSVILLLVALSGVLGWIPVAAVAGALISEAWFMLDRPSLALARQWLSRSPMSPAAREDLALVAAVTAAAAFINMVAAVLSGLLLGLWMFAVRNARRPVRRVATGEDLSSHCARPRKDLALLEAHGSRIRVVELEGDLFFGAADGLDRTLRSQLDGAACLVLDWSDVRHIDTSAAMIAGRFDRTAHARGIPVFHVIPPADPARVADMLSPHVPSLQRADDLDHGLEHAENHVLRETRTGEPGEATTLLEHSTLFHGLDPGQLGLLQSHMTQRIVPAGEPVMSVGEQGDGLMLVQEGVGSVLVNAMDGSAIRVAGVRRGAILGEMGFLDGSRRSARIVADEDMLVATLTREAFDTLSRQQPLLGQKVLSNIAIELAARLRHANRLAGQRAGGVATPDRSAS
jgi:sulfate permease, SulP family